MTELLERYVSQIKQDLQTAMEENADIRVGEVIDTIIEQLKFPGMNASSDMYHLSMTEEASKKSDTTSQ